MQPEKKTIFDFQFISAPGIAEVVANVFEVINDPGAKQIDFLITPNAYQLVHFNDPDNLVLKQFYRESTFILPDGMPVIWMSKLLNRKLTTRLTGSDLFPALWNEIKKRQLPVMLILPGKELEELFKKDYPASASLVPGIFQQGDENYINTFCENVTEKILLTKPSFVFLGLGFPKQEILGMHISAMLREKGYDGKILFLLLGASFEFYFRLKKRAPAFWQNTGLEWLYRFAKEPRRLWKRYTIDNLRFLALALREMKKGRT
jgi:N-acetylglucosaminyldiphosphoundecaprenol N-acetyl-beta-D-mannosaminyltransferase